MKQSLQFVIWKRKDNRIEETFYYVILWNYVVYTEHLNLFFYQHCVSS